MSQSLIPPVEALRRGFELDAQGAGAALAAAYRSNLASEAGQAQEGSLLLREGFHLGHLGLMIRYEDGSELSDLPTAYSLPNAPEWFVGMANLHGVLTPMFDLALYLGVERKADAKPMLLVLGHGADAAGVIIDGLPVRLRIQTTDAAEGAPAPSGLQGCLGQTYWAQGRVWMDLDVQALLSRLSEELAGADR